VSVTAQESDGDDDIPFAKTPKQVTVVMEGNATTEQISTVFEAYEDVDDGDLESIELVLKGPKRATLVTGQGIHAADGMVRDLVSAQHDDNVTNYLREAVPALPSVSLTLATGGFDGVVEVADRYHGDKSLESVTVASGDFALDRDDENGDPALVEARQQFVQQADRRFHLTGALVSGRGPLTLATTSRDRAALRHYVRVNASESLGRVVVRSQALP